MMNVPPPNILSYRLMIFDGKEKWRVYGNGQCYATVTDAMKAHRSLPEKVRLITLVEPVRN